MAISSAELGLLTIQSIVIHELPRRDQARKLKPTLSDAPSQLTKDVRVFFEHKIRGSLRAGFEVVIDPATASPSPAELLRLTGRGANPVPSSQKLAKHLFASQTSAMSGGLLVVAQATTGKTGAVAVLKLEKEEGVQLEQSKSKGKVTFDLAKVKNLMLTSATKVFKTGLFIKRGAVLDGLVTDSQRAASSTVATFFLEEFLGCKLTATPNVATNSFFSGVQRFIRQGTLEPTAQAALLAASIVEIESKLNAIDPKAFAQKHLDSHMRKPFAEALLEEGAPTKRFIKDLSLVSPRLKKIRITFTNGAQVLSPPSEIGRSVEIEDHDDGHASVVVTGELGGMKS